MPKVQIAHVYPDLVLAAVVCWALARGATDGAVWGFLGGIALDLLSGGPFGIHTFTTTTVGLVAGSSSALVPNDHWLLLPAVSLLCTILQQGAYVWLLSTAGWPLQWGPLLPAVVLPLALLNLGLTVLLYPAVGLLHRRTIHEELGW